MVDQRLVTYIRSELQKGYSKDTILTTLLKYGYSQDQVTGAFRQARPSKAKLFMFIILFALALGSTAVYFLYFTSQRETSLEEVRVRSIQFAPAPAQNFQEEEVNEEPIVRNIPETVKEEVLPEEPSEDVAIKDILALAGEEPQKARDLCLELTLRDQCLLEAGLTIHDQSFCSPIKNDDKRDTCYFNLALVEQNNLLCQDITDQHLKSTCAQI